MTVKLDWVNVEYPGSLVCTCVPELNAGFANVWRTRDGVFSELVICRGGKAKGDRTTFGPYKHPGSAKHAVERYLGLVHQMTEGVKKDG